MCAVLVGAAVMTSCARRKPESTVGDRAAIELKGGPAVGNGAGPVRRPGDSPGDSPSISIVPQKGASGGPPVLTFCFEDDPSHDPQVFSIRVAPIGMDKRKAFEIRALEGRWLWNEWVLGRVPSGFQVVEHGDLGPGVYEVYVYAFVGSGVVRMSIGEDGSVARLPWDIFDKGPPKGCPAVGGRGPRTLHGGLRQEIPLPVNATLQERRRRYGLSDEPDAGPHRE